MKIGSKPIGLPYQNKEFTYLLTYLLTYLRYCLCGRYDIV